ncbi:MAG: hypothetical protein CSA74_12220, partial [Rhodobacterales bacterium]
MTDFCHKTMIKHEKWILLPFTHFRGQDPRDCALFLSRSPALQTAELTGTNRNTINRIYLGLREHILIACEETRPMFGVVEVDESLFGPRRMKGKRGRGAYGKTTVFGIFERDGQVCTEIVPGCSKPALQ